MNLPVPPGQFALYYRTEFRAQNLSCCLAMSYKSRPPSEEATFCKVARAPCTRAVIRAQIAPDPLWVESPTPARRFLPGQEYDRRVSIIEAVEEDPAATIGNSGNCYDRLPWKA